MTYAARFLVTLSFVVSLATVALAAKQPINFRAEFTDEFGISEVGSGPPRILDFKRTSTVGRVAAYTDAHAMNRIGGILFMGVAQPGPDVENRCPTLSVDNSRPPGGKLRAAFSESTVAYGRLFDWELGPIFDYVSSGYDGLFSYMGQEAEYHRAFSDNLVGLNLFLLDTSRRYERFPSAHLFLAGPSIAGYPQSAPTAANVAAWQKLREFLGLRQLMFVDRGVNFVFSVQNGALTISGRPHWIVVERDEAGEGRTLAEFKDVATARLSNPTIYDSAYRVAMYSAFFRYMQASCKPQWAAFAADLRVKRGELQETSVPPARMWSTVLRN